MDCTGDAYTADREAGHRAGCGGHRAGWAQGWLWWAQGWLWWAQGWLDTGLDVVGL